MSVASKRRVRTGYQQPHKGKVDHLKPSPGQQYVLDVVNGFREQFGRWPTTPEIFPICKSVDGGQMGATSLRTHLLCLEAKGDIIMKRAWDRRTNKTAHALSIIPRKRPKPKYKKGEEWKRLIKTE